MQGKSVKAKLDALFSPPARPMRFKTPPKEYRDCLCTTWGKSDSYCPDRLDAISLDWTYPFDLHIPWGDK